MAETVEEYVARRLAQAFNIAQAVAFGGSNEMYVRSCIGSDPNPFPVLRLWRWWP